MLDINKLSAYELIEEKELSEVEGKGYVLSHRKTKARVLIVENKDNNKVFNIGFRTPPKDDTGVAHIMEHSVLCGSKNFPVKDPFVELCKGSLNTFLNAMTYPDKTMYPVASVNDKDFHNLMHVYLDAVFYPNIYDKEEIMMQEGWHYEVDEETGKLVYNGVVFNEMKGVYSNPEQILSRAVLNSLLPDTIYNHESGGDPAYITDLTREEFLNFHRRYYHPSNSYIYLYGDMDCNEELDFIDKEYLSNFDYLAIDSTITLQKEFEKPVSIDLEYSISDAEEEKDNTYLTYNVVFGTSGDKVLCTAMAVIETALFSMPGAPVKQALIDSGICKDVLTSVEDEMLQPQFSIVAKNANPEDEEKFKEIIEKSLLKVVEEGIDKKAFLAAINSFEFKHKEANFGRFPKGLMLGLNAYATWLYDDKEALSLFTMNDAYDAVKEYVENGYFEELIKKTILENNHKSFVKMTPKKGLNATIEEAESKKLADYQATLSEDDIKDIDRLAKHLKEYQESEDSEKDLEKIPLLEISDIDKEARKINNQFTEVADVKVVYHDIFTNGISYVSLNFDIQDIDYDMLPQVALLCDIFKYVDTENYSYNDLASEINIHTGGIGFTISLNNHKDYGKYSIHFVASAKMFDNKVTKGLELLEEILFSSKIDDKKRLKEIIAEIRSAIKNDIVSSGHTSAASRATSYISPIGVCKEMIEGMDYYEYISKLDDDFSHEYEKLADDLKTVLADILRRDSLVISYTGKNNVEELLKEGIGRISKKLSTRLTFENCKKPVVVKKNEGYKTASQVQYVATAGNYRSKGLPYNGKLAVLSTIFSYDYLWLNVRVKGGAYGCMCSFGRSGNVHFTSYRDPNLMETYDVYMKAHDYVAQFNCSKRDMTKYIIGTISKVDVPFTPSAEGKFSFNCYLMGVTDEDLQQERNEILTCTVDGIRELAPYIEVVNEEKIICVIGNEAKIDKVKDKFDEVKNLM